MTNPSLSGRGSALKLERRGPDDWSSVLIRQGFPVPSASPVAPVSPLQSVRFAVEGARMDGEPTAGAPLPPRDKGRVGIIDVGSNSIRLVVYERASRAPLPVFNEKVLCGLARGLDATGRLQPGRRRDGAGQHRPLHHARAQHEGDVARPAGDGGRARRRRWCRFHARSRERRPGITAHTGERPGRGAVTRAYGVICGMPDANGVMGDLGGGSLELVALGDGRLGESSTLPVGPLRLMSSGKGDPKRTVVEAIESVRWLREETGKTFYAVGGAWRSFARLHMEQAGYPLHIIHHYEIAAEEARAVARLIAVQSAKSLEKMPGVSRRRIDTLPLAWLALERLLVGAEAQDRGVLGLRPARGLLLLAAERGRAAQRHPLIAFAEEQGAGWRRFDLHRRPRSSTG